MAYEKFLNPSVCISGSLDRWSERGDRQTFRDGACHGSSKSTNGHECHSPDGSSEMGDVRKDWVEMSVSIIVLKRRVIREVMAELEEDFTRRSGGEKRGTDNVVEEGPEDRCVWQCFERVAQEIAIGSYARAQLVLSNRGEAGIKHPLDRSIRLDVSNETRSNLHELVKMAANRVPVEHFINFACHMLQLLEREYKHFIVEMARQPGPRRSYDGIVNTSRDINKKDDRVNMASSDRQPDRVNTASSDKQPDRVNTASSDRQYDRGNTASSDRQYDRGNTASSDKQPDRVNMASSDRQYDRGNTASSDRQPDRVNMASSDRQYDRGNTASSDRQPDRVNMASSDRQPDRVNTASSDRQYDRGNTASSDKQPDRVNMASSDRQPDRVNMASSDRQPDRVNMASSDRQYDRGNTASSDKQPDRVNTASSDRQPDRVNMASSDRQPDRVNMASSDRQYDRGNTASSDKQPDRVNMASSDRQPDRVNTASSDRQYDRGNTASSDKQPDRVNMASSDRQPDRVNMASSDRQPDRVNMASSDRQYDRGNTALSDKQPDRVNMASSDRQPDRVNMASSDRQYDRGNTASSDKQPDRVNMASSDRQYDRGNTASSDKQPDRVNMASSDRQYDRGNTASSDRQPDRVNIASSDRQPDRVNIASSDRQPDRVNIASSDRQPDRVNIASSDRQPDRVNIASSDRQPDRVNIASSDRQPDRVNIASSDRQPDRVNIASSDRQPDRVNMASSDRQPDRVNVACFDRNSERLKLFKMNSDRMSLAEIDSLSFQSMKEDLSLVPHDRFRQPATLQGVGQCADAIDSSFQPADPLQGSTDSTPDRQAADAKNVDSLYDPHMEYLGMASYHQGVASYHQGVASYHQAVASGLVGVASNCLDINSNSLENANLNSKPVEETGIAVAESHLDVDDIAAVSNVSVIGSSYHKEDGRNCSASLPTTLCVVQTSENEGTLNVTECGHELVSMKNLAVISNGSQCADANRDAQERGDTHLADENAVSSSSSINHVGSSSSSINHVGSSSSSINHVGSSSSSINHVGSSSSSINHVGSSSSSSLKKLRSTTNVINRLQHLTALDEMDVLSSVLGCTEEDGDQKRGTAPVHTGMNPTCSKSFFNMHQAEDQPHSPMNPGGQHLIHSSIHSRTSYRPQIQSTDGDFFRPTKQSLDGQTVCRNLQWQEMIHRQQRVPIDSCQSMNGLFKPAQSVDHRSISNPSTDDEWRTNLDTSGWLRSGHGFVQSPYHLQDRNAMENISPDFQQTIVESRDRPSSQAAQISTKEQQRRLMANLSTQQMDHIEQAKEGQDHHSNHLYQSTKSRLPSKEWAHEAFHWIPNLTKRRMDGWMCAASEQYHQQLYDEQLRYQYWKSWQQQRQPEQQQQQHEQQQQQHEQQQQQYEQQHQWMKYLQQKNVLRSAGQRNYMPRSQPQLDPGLQSLRGQQPLLPPRLQLQSQRGQQPLLPPRLQLQSQRGNSGPRN